MLLRERALQIALAESTRHVHEIGGNNRGPDVKKYLAEVGLGEGYSWCDAFVSWCYRQAAGTHEPFESAGVIITLEYARSHGWIVSDPQRGDLVMFEWGSDGAHDDHIGFVLEKIAGGVRTVEGNTGPQSGNVSDSSSGDGVFIRERVLPASMMVFVRVPGTVAGPAPVPTPVPAPKPAPAPAPAPKPAPKPVKPASPVIQQGATGIAVRRMQLDLNRHGAKLTVDGVFGPATAVALRDFQRAHRLVPDAVCGAQTWAALAR